MTATPQRMPGRLEGGPRHGLQFGEIPADTDSINVPLMREFEHPDRFQNAYYGYDRIEDGAAVFVHRGRDVREQCIVTVPVNQRLVEDSPIHFMDILARDAHEEMVRTCKQRHVEPFNEHLAWQGTVAEARLAGYGDWVTSTPEDCTVYFFVADTHPEGTPTPPPPYQHQDTDNP